LYAKEKITASLRVKVTMGRYAWIYTLLTWSPWDS